MHLVLSLFCKDFYVNFVSLSFYMSGKNDAKTKQYTYVHLVKTHFLLGFSYEQYTFFTVASLEYSSFVYSYKWEFFAGRKTCTKKCVRIFWTVTFIQVCLR